MHSLHFSASNGVSWTADKTLTIKGWEGTAGSSGTAGKIYFGASTGTLTATQLSHITFEGYGGTAILLSDGELVPGAQPTITLTPTTLSGFTYVAGSGPSIEQTFTITGLNLTSDATITPSTNYEISKGSGENFIPVSSIESNFNDLNTGGSQIIYVRLKSGLPVGDYNNEEITITSTGAETKTVTCSGTAIAPPTLTVNPISLSFNYVESSGPSQLMSFNVGAANLTHNLIISSTNTHFEISASFSPFTPEDVIQLAPDYMNAATLKTFFVRLKAGLTAGNYNTVINITSEGAESKTVTCSGEVIPSILITEHPSTVGQTICLGATANTLSVTATGDELTYQWYSNKAQSNDGGSLIDGATNSSYTPSTALAGTLFYYVVVSDANNSATSNVSGAVIVNDLPSTATNPNPANGATGVSYTGLDAVSFVSWDAVSSATSYDVYFGEGSLPTSFTTVNTNSYSTGTLSPGTTYYWKVVPENECGKTTGTPAEWTFTTSGPTITVSAASFDFGAVCLNFNSSEQYYTVSGSGLNADIVITPPAGFEISKTSGSGFSSTPITLIQTGGSVASTPIYVRFSPTSAGSALGNIIHTCTGATIKNVAVTGTGMTAPVADFTGSPTTVSAGGNITFTDNSTNTPTSWSWSFPGGTPATSTNQNPLITYYSAGIYSVSLIATNSCGSDTETKTEYITVSEPVKIYTTPGGSTFTVPDNVYQITVQVWGGGGNGGAATVHLGAGGGGGGAYSSSKLSVIPGESYDLWVGQGAVSLANGQDSWFGSVTTVMAKGGEFGGANSITPGKGGSADMGYGDIKFKGGDGAGGSSSNSGGGGSSAGTNDPGNSATNYQGAEAPEGGGNGGDGINDGVPHAGYPGSVPGGGGGGPYCDGTGLQLGGNGADGAVIISWIPAGGCTPPDAPTAEAQSFCSSESNLVSDLFASGAEGATFNWYAVSVDGSPLNETDELSTGTYYVSQTVAACESERTAVDVTINTTPDAFFATTASNSPVCSGQDAVFYLEGTAGATVSYSLDGGTTTSTVGLDGSGLATITITGVTENQTLTLSNVDDELCNKDLNGSATVTVNPLPDASFATTASNTPVCEGGNAEFYLTGTANAVVSYRINDIYGETNNTVTFNPSGEATVVISGVSKNQTMQLVSIQNPATGCARLLSVSSMLEVMPLPFASFDTPASNSPVCSGDDAHFYISATPECIITYNMNGAADNETVTIDASGKWQLNFPNAQADITVQLISIEYPGFLCPVGLEESNTVVVNPLPVATFAATASNSPVCSGQDAAFYLEGTPYATVTYSIDGGTTTSKVGLDASGLDTITIKGVTENQTLTLTNVDDELCNKDLLESNTVAVNPVPTATISYDDSPYCATGTASVTLDGPEGGTFNCGSGLNLNGTTGEIDLANSYPGKYNVTYQFTGDDGCPGLAKTIIEILELPEVEAGIFDDVCMDAGVVALPTGGVWVGDGVSGNQTDGYFFDPTGHAGDNTLTFIVTDSETGCENSDEATIHVNDQPTVTAGTYGPVCVDAGDIALIGTPSGGVWDGTGVSGDQTSGYVFDPTGNIGDNTLTYTFTDSETGCENYDDASIHVNRLPTVDAGSYPAVCVDGSDVELVGTPAGGTWSGTGVTGNYFDPSEGTQTVTYTYTDQNGCSNSDDALITVNPLPTVDAGTYAAVCIDGSDVELVGTPAGGTWSGTGVTGNYFDPSEGTQTVTYTYTDQNGCSNSDDALITVNPLPEVDAGTYAAVCIDGSDVELVGTPAGGTWSGTGVTGNYFDPSEGTQTVTYTYTDQNGCSNSDDALITVNPLPTVDAGTYAAVCIDGSDVELVGTPAGGTWSGTGVTGNYFDPSEGTQTVTYTYTDQNGCSNSDDALITVNPLPTVDAGTYAAVCIDGSDVELVGTPAGGTWSGTGVTGNYFDPSEGTQTVTYTYTDQNGCSNSDDALITVNPLPTVDAGTYAAVCEDADNVALVGSPPGGVWEGTGVSGDQTSGYVFDPTGHLGDNSLTYTFTNGNSCENSDVTSIQVNDLPVVSDITLQMTIDPNSNGGWFDVEGDFPNFNQCLFSEVQYFYLDVDQLVSSVALEPGVLNGFRLTHVPDGFWDYWNAKGVDVNTPVLGDILSGKEPVCYLKYTGPVDDDYILIDGFLGGNNLFRIDGDYPEGDYTITGTVEDVNGCVSKEFDVNLTIKQMPRIVTQPVSVLTCKGSSATFSVVAFGTDLEYTWYKVIIDEDALELGHEATLTIDDVKVEDAGSYYVIVSGACTPDGGVWSDYGELMVKELVVNQASIQYSDPVTYTATIYNAGKRLSFNSVDFMAGSTKIGNASMNTVGNNLVGILADEPMILGPGNYSVKAEFKDAIATSSDLFVDDCTISSDIAISCEDADVDYIGVNIIGEANVNVYEAPVELKATITDFNDNFRGDIRNARVRFYNGETAISGWLTPTLINPVDPTQGIVSSNWLAPVPKAGYTTYDIIVKVGTDEGYYVGEDISPLTVYRTTLNEFITGGGHIKPIDSKGEFASDPGRKVNFGFNIKWNKTMKNLQGNLNVIFRRGNQIYQIKTNAMSSLGIDGSDPCSHKAVFTSKANLTNVTISANSVTIYGGLQLQVTLTDNGDPGVADMIGITLYNGSDLIYSSSWPVSMTEELNLLGGNIVVNDGLKCNATDVTHTIITSDKNPSLTGDVVTFTASVYGADDVPEGNVEFIINGASIDRKLESDGTVSVDYTFGESGSYEIVANYTSSNGYKSSTGSLTQLVNGISLALSSTKNPSVVGDNVTFIAAFKGFNVKLPQGYIDFKVDGKFIGQRKIDESGIAEITTKSDDLSVGVHDISAQYYVEGSEPVSIIQTVIPVSMTLNSSKTTVATGELVVLTASVNTSVLEGKTVSFKEGDDKLLGTAEIDESGSAVLPPISFETEGTHTITASITEPNLLATLDLVVQKPWIVLLSSVNPSADGQAVIFTAKVTGGNDGRRVTFTTGSTVIEDTLSSGDATWTASFTEGSYLITATYYDESGTNPISESSLTQVVKSNLTITLTSSKNPVQYNNDVTFTAVVSGSVLAPTGVVTFDIDGDPIGSFDMQESDNGVATLTHHFSSTGNYRVTATYNEITATLLQQVKNKVKAAEIITGIESVIEYADLKVYPNPFSERLKFEFVSPVDTHVRIDMYDLTGRLIRTVFNNQVEAETKYTTDFIPENTVSGMYIYRMIMGESVFNGKVTYKGK